MEHLWSPWRLAYITGASGGADTGCIFCDTAGPGRDELILIRGSASCVILNLYPYNNGHLMVATIRRFKGKGRQLQRSTLSPQSTQRESMTQRKGRKGREEMKNSCTGLLCDLSALCVDRCSLRTQRALR